ncbi:DUF167 family protein [Caulobacter sp. 17J65-9]|uniref:DUF167 family protein n=1 Tax=Caulobacter sp. 17J65-9 TaxID=2709382 RepID=UPI0013C6815A|nr:DUF167 domain-containing protein [Caulobacter sp. 17J65-9]
MRVAVRLTPRGGADRVDGWDRDDAGRLFLKVRVRAAPVEGEANAALEALLARTLGLSKSAVKVERGATQRLKQVEIAGLDEAALHAAFGTPDASSQSGAR